MSYALADHTKPRDDSYPSACPPPRAKFLFIVFLIWITSECFLTYIWMTLFVFVGFVPLGIEPQRVGLFAKSIDGAYLPSWRLRHEQGRPPHPIQPL